jgi:hypothetical protein
LNLEQDVVKDECGRQPNRQAAEEGDELLVLDDDEVWIEGSDLTGKHSVERARVVQRKPIEPRLTNEIVSEILLEPGLIGWVEGRPRIDERDVHPRRWVPERGLSARREHSDPVS